MSGYTPAEMARLFSKIERELASFADTARVLERLVQTAVDTVPGAEHAGISFGKDGHFATTAATAEIVAQVDAVQYRLGSGPCVDAIVDDTLFNVHDLRVDPRWPQFGAEAYERTGIVSLLALRMFLENDQGSVAGLNLYSSRAEAFDETGETMATLLATHGALAVSNAAAREKATNLMIALKNGREIGVAMGVLMKTYVITRDEAFDLLRIASQNTHRKLSAIATEVADTGELPMPSSRSDEAGPK
jgi:hypothetical protein